MNKWVVSLNDGQRISQKDLLDQNSEESKENPWTRLMGYIRANKNADGSTKYITHVEVMANGIHFQSPTRSKNSSFYSGEEPKLFWVFYKDFAGLMGGGSPETLTAFSYRTGEHRHFVYAQEGNKNVYFQCLNVKNPTSKVEKQFSAIEAGIEQSYEGIENGGKS